MNEFNQNEPKIGCIPVEPSELFDLRDRISSGQQLSLEVRDRMENRFWPLVDGEESEVEKWHAEVAREGAARGCLPTQHLLKRQAAQRILDEGFSAIANDVDVIELLLSSLAIDQLRSIAADAANASYEARIARNPDNRIAVGGYRIAAGSLEEEYEDKPQTGDAEDCT